MSPKIILVNDLNPREKITKPKIMFATTTTDNIEILKFAMDSIFLLLDLISPDLNILCSPEKCPQSRQVLTYCVVHLNQ